MNTILLRLGATPAERAECLKRWLDDAALYSGVPASCLARSSDQTRIYGRFDGMKGHECLAFEVFLDSCSHHMQELSDARLSWGQWTKFVGGGRGNCSSGVLSVGMFQTR